MSLRQVVFDTETTGLDRNTDRVVEIGAVEIVDYIETGRTLHLYVNPERDMPLEAERIHGLSSTFLSDKPLFREIAQQFLDFIGGDDLVAHNGGFDFGMLNAELARLGKKQLENKLIDTVQIARRRYPGTRYTLDALLDRFEIDRSGREKHGALIDSQLLARVYMYLLDRHTLLHSEVAPAQTDVVRTVLDTDFMPNEARLIGFSRSLVRLPDDSEASAHADFIAKIKDSVWSRIAVA